jgi:hypothetical protein
MLFKRAHKLKTGVNYHTRHTFIEMKVTPPGIFSIASHRLKWSLRISVV